MNALLVEDIAKTRKYTVKMLKNNGFSKVYEASNKKDALEIFRESAHLIDIAFLDYRLDDGDVSNRDGLDVAKYLKKFKPEVITVGISAFADDYPGHQSHVDYFFHKAAAKNDPNRTALTDISLKNLINNYFNLRQQSLQNLPARLLELKRKYLISDSDFRELIQLHPITPSVEKALLLVQKQFSIDGDDEYEYLYNNDKQKVSLIAPEFYEFHGVKLKCPLIIVVSHFDDCYISELYGFPNIYAYGDSEEESNILLINLLVDYKTELASLPSETKFKTDIAQFRYYLEELFGV